MVGRVPARGSLRGVHPNDSHPPSRGPQGRCIPVDVPLLTSSPPDELRSCSRLRIRSALRPLPDRRCREGAQTPIPGARFAPIPTTELPQNIRRPPQPAGKPGNPAPPPGTVPSGRGPFADGPLSTEPPTPETFPNEGGTCFASKIANAFDSVAPGAISPPNLAPSAPESAPVSGPIPSSAPRRNPQA